MSRGWLLVVAVAALLVACGDGGSGEKTGTTAPGDIGSARNDGVTLTTATAQRVTGSYVASDGVNQLTFDLAKLGDDIYADVKGTGGRPIIHIETVGEDYDFTYMGGGLTLHTTKSFVAQARAQAAAKPDAVSTDGFAFTGDMHVLDDMLKLPEVASLPHLSRALGVRGITGPDFPASLALHKMGRQSADALGIQVEPLNVLPSGANGYCDAYPNADNACYGMCGPGCSCWGWVCGDCCYHYGCAVHDSWCREGKWWLCYDISAVIALFGC